MYKKVIILPYFGDFPKYIDLFIKSCEYNQDYDFLIISDNEMLIELPKNIKKIKMTFEECKNLICTKIKKRVDLNEPYKLCDYRPSYGIIFQDYIKEYNFWGYCDCDMILGKLSNFLKNNIFEKYDKILIQGHLTFYRNTDKVNHYYYLESNKYITFEEAISIQEPCFFDEISMPNILKENKIKQYENYNFLDILPQYSNFRLSKICSQDNEIGACYYWKNGSVYMQYTDKDNQKVNKEFMYIHFQKRKMPMNDVSNKDSMFFISANGFTKNIMKEKANRRNINYYVSQIKKININRIKIKIVIKLKRKIFKIGGNKNEDRNINFTQSP